MNDRHRPLTRLAHELLRAQLCPGDIAIDATAGNGHDTLFLAQAVGLCGKVAAVTFNLGYLPGADHATTTGTNSTLEALEQALTLLRPGGALSVLAYPGHRGGQEEAQAVAAWCNRQAALTHELHESPGPVLHFCIRK